MIVEINITIQRYENSNHIIPTNDADHMQVETDKNFHMFSNHIHVNTINTIDANNIDKG